MELALREWSDGCGGWRGSDFETGSARGGERVLAVEVVGLRDAEEFPGRAEAPLVGVGIVAGVDGRVVGDDEDFEVGVAGVEELVRYAGRVDKHVAYADGREAVGRAHGADAGADEEQFPLTEVEVVGANGGTGQEAADLEIEGMAAAPRAGVARAAEGEGEVAAK